MTVTSYFPQPQKPAEDPNWPSSLRKAFTDAQHMFSQGISPSIILTTCGTVLELALKELDQSDCSQSLFQRIEALHDNGVITSPIRDWAHSIRLDRNGAVHNGEGNEAEANEYIEFLKLFFYMVFSLPNRIEVKRGNTL